MSSSDQYHVEKETEQKKPVPIILPEEVNIFSDKSSRGSIKSILGALHFPYSILCFVSISIKLIIIVAGPGL